MRALTFAALALLSLTGCALLEDEGDPNDPLKQAMERACALDVRGEYTVTSVGGSPAEGSLSIAGAANTLHVVDVTVTRNAPFTAEAPFFALVDDPAAQQTVVLAQAVNRFIGAGNTGNAHSEVTGVAALASAGSPGAASARVQIGFRLVVEATVAAAEGSYDLTYEETRPNVIIEGEYSHTEQRPLALRAVKAEPVVRVVTTECQEAIDAYSARDTSGS